MENMYTLRKLTSQELDQIVGGGGIKDLIRKAACALGECDYNALIKIEEKSCIIRGDHCIFTKFKCPTCGRLHYYRYTSPSNGSGYYEKISESRYNSAPAGTNLLAI
jgi:hypothetical protein